jgi:transposase InsO family protein
MPALDQHLAWLQEWLRLEKAQDDCRPRRCNRQPTPRQRLQQLIRQEVVECYHHLHAQGLTAEQVGQRLHLTPRTLRYYDRVCRCETIALLSVGRPMERAPLPLRQQILAFLNLTGPGVGVPTVKEQFPAVPRGELADLLARYRAVWRARHQEHRRVLHWQTPGRVWAADFTESKHLAPDLAPRGSGYVLAVRDLASGYMVAWEPLPNLTEQVTHEVLARLVALHGAPLILKVDNGSAFRAERFLGLLEASGVIALYSPPACPGYNGSVEAAIGSLKKRTEQRALAHGRSGGWTRIDLAAAESAANTSHPRRLNGRTPLSVWESRTPIAAVERVVFELTVERQRFGVREEWQIEEEELFDHWRQSAVDRRAIERALVEHGHLLFTGRRIPQTIWRRKVTADV